MRVLCERQNTAQPSARYGRTSDILLEEISMERKEMQMDSDFMSAWNHPAKRRIIIAFEQEQMTAMAANLSFTAFI